MVGAPLTGHDRRRKKAAIVNELMDRLGPRGWGLVDLVMHSSALMRLPLETLETLEALMPRARARADR
jgi:hypothetical protein